MARKRRQDRDPIHGIVLVDKPKGLTSNAVLQKVMRMLNAQKGGHTGALDPFATGLLPICLGEATKVSGLLLDADKRYLATLKLGEATTTGDLDGEVILTQSVPELTDALLESTLEGFLGEGEQVPPMFSALKHQGKPLYEYARQGIEIERPARPIHIKSLKLLSFQPDEIQFEVLCSKGTYVRTLGEDIAKALNTVGHLTALRRTQTGSLTADQMLSLEALEEKVAEGEPSLFPLDIALTDTPSLTLNDEQVDFLRHGGMLKIEKPDADIEQVRLYDAQGQIVAMGEWHPKTGLLKAKRVFQFA